MAEIKRTDPHYPRGGRGKSPKKGHKLRNTLLALTGAGILGGGAYMLADRTDTEAAPAPQAPVQQNIAPKTHAKPVVKNQGFPAFNPKPMQLRAEDLKAYNDLRGHDMDVRFPAEQHGPNPFFTNIRNDFYNRLFSHLQSGKFQTVDQAINVTINEQFSTFKHHIVNRTPRENKMVNKLPVQGINAYDMLYIANQIMTYQDTKWVHGKEWTPQMRDNTVIFFGRVATATGQIASNHLNGYTPSQAAIVMELTGAGILEKDLLGDAQDAHIKELKSETGHNNTLNSQIRYEKMLELTKNEIKRGVDPFLAAVSATNAYKTQSYSARQDNKTYSFVYRFAALSDVLAGKTDKADQIKALDAAMENPNIMLPTKDKTQIPWGGFCFAALTCVVVGGVAKWVYKNANAYDNRIKPNSNHANPAVARFRDAQNGVSK